MEKARFSSFVAALLFAAICSAFAFAGGFYIASSRVSGELASYRESIAAAERANDQLRSGIAEARVRIAGSTESVERSLGSIGKLGSIQSQFRVVLAELGKYIASVRAEYEALEALLAGAEFAGADSPDPTIGAPDAQ